MADHGLDDRKENELATRIKNLEDQVQALRSLQAQGASAVNLQTSSTVTSTCSVIGGDTAAFRTVLTSTSGAAIFGIPFITMYYGSVADVNVLGVNGVPDRDWFCSYRTDWRNSTAGKLVAFGSAQNMGSFLGGTIVFKSSWLYFIQDGSVAVSTETDPDWNGGIIA